ncbi:DUF234 domain-containing protein [Microbispora rosea]|uniref:DUF234 domain-containing protein n=1 Tax=Microbispora rosea TaxID=58117 RepID=UPI003D91683A
MACLGGDGEHGRLIQPGGVEHHSGQVAAVGIGGESRVVQDRGYRNGRSRHVPWNGTGDTAVPRRQGRSFGGAQALEAGHPTFGPHPPDRGIPLVERGRGERVLATIERSWTSWRGRAVEPVVRQALSRLLPDDRWPETDAIGGWWNRQNNPEIDLVGADREPVARHVQFLGSIKWLENGSFGRHEYESLVRDMLAVPGADTGTPLVAVSRSGVDDGLPLAAHWGPEDLLAAWH